MPTLSGLAQAISPICKPEPTFTEKDIPDLSHKVFVVTGATSGVGLELSRILYSKNANVYVCGRSTESFEKAKADIIAHPAEGFEPKTGEVAPFIFNLEDLPTIPPAVSSFLEKETVVNGVWFNAGVMNVPSGSTTKQGYEIHWGINVVGHFLLQQLLLDLLVSSAQSTPTGIRVVWVSSSGNGFSPTPDGIEWSDINHEHTKASPMKLYGQSKAGNIMIAHELARKYGEKGITSVSLHPGPVQTNLQRHTPDMANKLASFMLSDVRHGAITELYAGFSPDVTPEQNGRFIQPWGKLGHARPDIEHGLNGKGTGQRLWDVLTKEIEKYCT